MFVVSAIIAVIQAVAAVLLLSLGMFILYVLFVTIYYLFNCSFPSLIAVFKRLDMKVQKVSLCSCLFLNSMALIFYALDYGLSCSFILVSGTNIFIFIGALYINAVRIGLLPYTWQFIHPKIAWMNSLLKTPQFISTKPRVVTGIIYILTSLDSRYSNLVKIGFTTKDIASRIAGAESQSTYLYNKVKVEYMVSFTAKNINDVESIVHKRVDKYRKYINVNGKVATEWFELTPQQAKTIVDYIYLQIAKST